MDISPFEGDPRVTCKSFLEPLPGYGTKMLTYGGNILNFVPHRVQVFSISNVGESLSRIAAEAVLNRGIQKAQFSQQARTSVSVLDEGLPGDDVAALIGILDGIIFEIERLQANPTGAP